jgi:hypothetical protein
MKNTKQTSAKVATLAAEKLQDPNASQIAKSLAGAALAQRNTHKQTGAEMEELAAKVLGSDKYAEDTKTLAGAVLSQANKDR